MLSSKIPAILLLCMLLQNTLPAQDKLNIKFGKVTPEDFNITSPLIDSSTSAVVVAEVGKSEFIAGRRSFTIKFTSKKRIKIISKNGFAAATISIPLYFTSINDGEKLDALSAYTYNIENGAVVETKVDKASVFTEKTSDHWMSKKFTFPALKEGSIIEYSYTVLSDYFFNLQPWTCQGEYPVLWSQYEAGIPEFYKYVILAQGYQPFFINKMTQAQAVFSFMDIKYANNQSGGFTSIQSNQATEAVTVNGKVDHHTWIMKNVPALKEEAFTTTVDNSVAKIEFQLNLVAFPNTPPRNVMNTWENVARELMNDDNFGIPINKGNSWLDDVEGDIVKNATTKLEKTQKIFQYLRDNFTFNNNHTKYTVGLKEVFKSKSGSVADINLLLIAMLRNQQIDANPVILSTRANGAVHEFYPLLSRYNYVIAKVNIDNSIIYLDATVPELAFGKLPLKVYNGQAREITKDGGTAVYFIADSLNEAAMTSVFLSNGDEGVIQGNFSHSFGLYESLKLRKKMTKTSPDDFQKSIHQEYSDEFEVENIQIDSLKLLNKPVELKYDLKVNSFKDGDIIYFNPMLGAAIKNNPFTAAERLYPVEMPYTTDDIYTLMMEIPKGYAVDELPKSTRLNFNESDMKL